MTTVSMSRCVFLAHMLYVSDTKQQPTHASLSTYAVIDAVKIIKILADAVGLWLQLFNQHVSWQRNLSIDECNRIQLDATANKTKLVTSHFRRQQQRAKLEQRS